MNRAAEKKSQEDAKPKDAKESESYIEEIKETKTSEPKKFKRIANEESDD